MGALVCLVAVSGLLGQAAFRSLKSRLVAESAVRGAAVDFQTLRPSFSPLGLWFENATLRRAGVSCSVRGLGVFRASDGRKDLVLDRPVCEIHPTPKVAGEAKPPTRALLDQIGRLDVLQADSALVRDGERFELSNASLHLDARIGRLGGTAQLAANAPWGRVSGAWVFGGEIGDGLRFAAASRETTLVVGNGTLSGFFAPSVGGALDGAGGWTVGGSVNGSLRARSGRGEASSPVALTLDAAGGERISANAATRGRIDFSLGDAARFLGAVERNAAGVQAIRNATLELDAARTLALVRGFFPAIPSDFTIGGGCTARGDLTRSANGSLSGGGRFDWSDGRFAFPGAGVSGRFRLEAERRDGASRGSAALTGEKRLPDGSLLGLPEARLQTADLDAWIGLFFGDGTARAVFDASSGLVHPALTGPLPVGGDFTVERRGGVRGAEVNATLGEVGRVDVRIEGKGGGSLAGSGQAKLDVGKLRPLHPALAALGVAGLLDIEARAGVAYANATLRLSGGALRATGGVALSGLGGTGRIEHRYGGDVRVKWRLDRGRFGEGRLGQTVFELDFRREPLELDISGLPRSARLAFSLGTLVAGTAVQDGPARRFQVNFSSTNPKAWFDRLRVVPAAWRVGTAFGGRVSGRGTVDLSGPGAAGRFDFQARLPGGRLGGPFQVNATGLSLSGKAVLKGRDVTALGRVRVERGERGFIRTDGLDLPFRFAKGRLDLHDAQTPDFPLSALGGEVRVAGLSIDRLFSPERRISLNATAAGLDLSGHSRGLAQTRASGAWRNIRIDRDFVRADDGELRAPLYGGELLVKGLAVAYPFQPEARQYRFHAGLIDFDLDSASAAFGLGRITGKADLTLSEVHVAGLRPIAGVLRFSTRDEAPERRISLDAVRGISRASTGAGFDPGVLGRAYLRFFEDFPYEAVGLSVGLKGDACTLRGREFPDGREYFLKRSGPFGVDVVNTNPDNLVSVEEMLVRIRKKRNKEWKPALRLELFR